MHKITCTECNGTGNMSVERANELTVKYCRRFGCEECQGFGIIEVENEQMTRNEAIDIEVKKLDRVSWNISNRIIATANIDALIELGLLKFDEPKSADEILEEAFKYESCSWEGVKRLLAANGYKLVKS